MSFFYDLNKRLADLATKQDAAQLTESVAVAEKADYSAKKAAAGKDIGKPGKMFSKIAKSAGKEYGSKAAGERVAGAVLNKLRAKESVSEGSMKQEMHKAAERMSLEQFVAKYGNEKWVREFYNNTVGPMDETASKALTLVRNNLAPYAEEIADIIDQGRMAVLDDNFLDNENDIEQYADVLLKMSNLFRRNPIKGLEYLGTLWSEIQEMTIGEIRDQLKIDLGQMYNQAFPNTGRSFEESALQAYLGKKKYGDAGMKALQKAGRDQASDKTMDTIRNRYDKYDEGMTDEGNEFSGELVKARASGAKQFKVDGKSYPVKEADAPMTPKQKSFAKLAPPANKITFADKIAGAKKEVDEMLGDVAAEAIKSAIGKNKEPRSKGTAFDPEVLKTMTSTDPHPRYDVKDTGYSKRYTRKVQDEPKDDADVDTGPKKKGRPKGPEKGPERVTKGSYKFKSGRPAKTKEDRDPGADRGEYGREGDMAKEQMRTIMSAAKELRSILDDEQDLPEWVQKKITLAMDYIDTARDYMLTQDDNAVEPVAEKAVSKKQQRFMGMVHATKKGEKASSPEVAKATKGMGKKDAEDFAATKHKGLPEKVKTKKKDESVEETADAPKEKKSSGGYNFGGGVYESLDRKFQQALTEGMNVSVNMSTGQDGQPTKSINISADGDDADKLADLLKMAGLHGHAEETCTTCGSTPCGCESLDENSPDWPTNTETSDDAMQYSGGLNGPKSTGQTTTPVIASQLRRQVSMEEGVKIEQSLFKLYNQYKLK